jgi:hypothetical protein
MADLPSGTLTDNQGDSFFFVFRRARDAVLATANAQRALAARAWPEDGTLKVVKKIKIGNTPADLAVAGGAVWVAVG